MKNKIIYILATITISLCTILFSGCSLLSCNGSNSLLTRNATNNDINIDLSEDFALSMNYKVTPKVDISDLQITFKYYDEDKTLISTKVKTVGNVTQNNQITVSISFLNEFSFSELLQITYSSADVTGGTVSLFA